MVKKRNPLFVIVASLVTLGLYALYWFYQTKQEMDGINKENPSGIVFLIMLLIPVVNLYALWQYCAAAEKAVKGQGAVVLFILSFVFFPATQYLVQSGLNKL